MSYHVVPNDTTAVELTPFTALEDNIEEEDYEYRRPSSNIRMPPFWHSSSSSTNGQRRFFCCFFGETWQDICDSCIRRWQLLSKRRQKQLQIAMVFGGVLLIVMALEMGVKTIYHNHVKSATPIVEEEDWNELVDDFYNENNENEKGNDGTKLIQAYDIPVNRVLCEQVIPSFKILDESLDHYCFQRNKMKCKNVDRIFYERESVFYDSEDGSQLLPSSLVDCHPPLLEAEIWSPLAPFHPAYDQICQDDFNSRHRSNDDTETAVVVANRFCNSDQIDWSKAQELLPKCLLEETSCNDLNWNMFQDVMGGHLNCWEFKIAYQYMEHQKAHPEKNGVMGDDLGSDDYLCKGVGHR